MFNYNHLKQNDPKDSGNIGKNYINYRRGINESQLHTLIQESVKKVLKEIVGTDEISNISK